MQTRKRFSVKMTQILGPYYLYEATHSIDNIGMDPRGNLIINQQPAVYRGQILAGFTVVTHDFKEGKLLLKRDFEEAPQQIRKPFIDY